MLATFADVFRIATFQAPMPTGCIGTPDSKDEVRRLRSEIRHLDAHLLRDIGLDPDTLDDEECPPVWRWSPR